MQRGDKCNKICAQSPREGIIALMKRGLKGDGHKFQHKTQSQLPLGNHLPFLSLVEIWPLLSSDWEHCWGRRQPAGEGCSTAADSNKRLQPWSVVAGDGLCQRCVALAHPSQLVCDLQRVEATPVLEGK